MRAVCLLLAFASPVCAQQGDFIFPGPYAIRFEIAIDGQSPSKQWDAFLDRVFDTFDRDGDRKLSKAEANRMPFSLDCAGTRAEFKAGCAAQGFADLRANVTPPLAQDAWLGKLFAQHTNLQPFDANDDEYLDLIELLAVAPAGEKPAPFVSIESSKKPDAIVRVNLGKAPRVTLEDPQRKLTLTTTGPGTYRLTGPAGMWSASIDADRTADEFQTVREFLIAQWKTAAEDRAVLTRANVEDDFALSGLLAIFRFADRNGDERLTLAELEAYLDLLEAGVRAQVWLTLADRGTNPFPLLDANRDGRLDVRERKQAYAGRIATWSFRRTAAMNWGGVQVPASKPRVRPSVAGSAPAWFAAQDQNRDGWISPREFLGTPELFRTLDLDGDGLIDVAEAKKR